MLGVKALLFLSLACSVHAQRVATVAEVQPTARDTVRTIWINGPAYSSKLSNFPSFGSGTLHSDTQCTTKNDRYTGYNAAGQYCEKASDALDTNAHLLLTTGRIAAVLDAGGLAPTLSLGSRNLFPKLGSTSGGTPRAVYDALPTAGTSFTYKQTCSDGTTTTHILGTSKPKFIQAGLVRQGHTVTQLTLTGLTWHNAQTGAELGPCGTFTPQRMTSSPNCNGSPSWPCPSSYPDCQGFVQGQSWGKCYSACSFTMPNVWAELSIWGDSIAFELAWDAPYNVTAMMTAQQQSQQVTCSASIAASLTLKGASAVTRTASATVASGGRLTLLVTSQEDGTVAVEDASASPAHPVTVTSSTSGTQVRTRSTTKDAFIEIPGSTQKCGYNVNCANVPLMLVNMVATNPHPSKTQTLRLSFSRGYQTRDQTVSRSYPSAEITGFNAQLWDTAAKQATGIPMQISKNWHVGSNAAFWAGYDGSWWTASSLLRLPPNSKISLSLALSYERYGSVPAWSHAQLSIVGYSDKWLWEESALGSSGEQMCFDPIGAHTRAMITDVRPKLFDGKWKENIGGGDFLLLFSSSGAMQYLKELNPLIHASGPCLSNASYTAITADETMSSHVEVSGARTDDFVRLFLKLRYKALKSFTFSRLAFFQTGSETYNYRALQKEFVVSSTGTGGHTVHTRTCAGGTSKSSNKMYEGGPFRTSMSGTAPWWIALNDNQDPATIASAGGMVVGDKGLVIRKFKARLGGVEQQSPSFSVLCDKIELGTPAGLLNLVKDDFVEMDLEFMVLPRVGSEYNLAKTNSQSKTLQSLASMSQSWERVQAQASKGQLTVTGEYGTRVESEYPIRACATANDLVKIKVEGTPLGFVPVVICDLTTHAVPSGGTHGLWTRPSEGVANYTLVQQGSSGVGGNDFWQTNYDRSSGKYELVYNIELTSSSTIIAFGSDPALWPEYSAPSPSSEDVTLSGSTSSRATPSWLQNGVMLLAFVVHII